MTLRITNPFTRYNHDLILDEDQQDVFLRNSHAFVNQTLIDPRIPDASTYQDTMFFADFLSQSFVYVITETVGEYPYPYFSEKTWKAFNTGVPFLMVNAQHSLKKLQELGFKTFSQWWDEGYDSKTTVADRIESLTSILYDLSKLSDAELASMRKEMQATIDYNHNYLKIFAKKDLMNIIKSI